MSYKVVPFKRWHVAWLEEAGNAEGGFWTPGPDVLRQLEQMPNMWTVAHDDQPLVCGGSIQHWPGRSECWAYLNKNSGPHMRVVTKVAREKLWSVHGRMEFTVRRDFAKGHRWARMIGFYVEQMPGLEIEKLPVEYIVPGQMRAWGPEGEDHVLYVRHNKSR